MHNFWFSKELFDLVKECKISKVISIGSQAEYGSHGFIVNEDTIAKPDDAYGSIKIITSNYLRNLFDNTDITWYWLRIFSVFGEGENTDWLIPSVILKLLKKEYIQLTACEQLYNYLYIRELTNNLFPIIDCKKNNSGIYNLCNSDPVCLKNLLMEIADLIGVSHQLLQFGKLPYRLRQNMIISGSNLKYKKAFEANENIRNITEGLKNTIEYHKKGKL